MDVNSLRYNGLFSLQKIDKQSSFELTDEEKKKVEELKKKDAEIKKHEQAHKRAAAGIKSTGPHYKYTIGPDGRRYVKDGHVNIDIAEVPNNPEATIKKAQQIRRAALAPGNPSPQDLRIANQAAAMEAKARMEMIKEKNKENSEGTKKNRTIEFTYYPDSKSSYLEVMT